MDLSSRPRTIRPLRAATLLGCASLLLAGGPVDPAPTWTMMGGEENARFGAALAFGDVDGDGVDDLIVGEPKFTGGEGGKGGRVLVYPGSLSGLGAEPIWTAECMQAGAQFGAAVAAGDVDGDQIADVIVGAPGFNGTLSNEGQVFVYLGAGGWPAIGPSWNIGSGQVNAALGTAVATGDVNGDGCDDVVAGAWGYDNGQSNEGRAYVYLGSDPGGLGETAAWTAEGDKINAHFGSSVACGNLYGNAGAAVIVGAPRYDGVQVYPDGGQVQAPNAGRVFVYRGGDAGPSPTADWTAAGDQLGGLFGTSVASGDIDGNGYADLVVGARGMDDGQNPEQLQGAAFVFYADPVGIGISPGSVLYGDQGESAFGWAVSAGDVNGDGWADVIVSATVHNYSASYEGRVNAYLGNATGLALSPAWTVDGGQAGAKLGSALATGDVNGDGFADVAVGAEDYDSDAAPDTGAVFVHRGRGLAVTGLAQFRLDGQAPVAAGGLTAEAGFVADATVEEAGDNPVEIEVELKPVGTYFDENALVTGTAPQVTVGGLDVGTSYHWRARARIVATGLTSRWRCFGSNPDDQQETDLGARSNVAPSVSTPRQLDPRIGASIPAGGQASGEIVGFALTINDPEGDAARIEVEVRPVGEPFHGTAMLVGGTAAVESTFPVGAYHWQFRSVDTWGAASDWTGFGGNAVTAADFRIVGGSLGGGLGCLQSASASSPACAIALLLVIGIAGVRRRSWPAGAIVVAGALAGPVDRADACGGPLQEPPSIVANPSWTFEGAQTAGTLASSISGAGDVNGDGFDDLVVGEPTFTSEGLTHRGRVLLFYGSETGLAADVSWSATGEAAELQLGYSVSAAGNVDGDAYDDFIAGSFAGTGVAVVYLGSADGPVQGRTVTGGAGFGGAVACAGDVDGDGLSDVIIGAPSFNQGKGAAYVYRGNAATVLSDNADFQMLGTIQGGQFGAAVSRAGDVDGSGLDAVVVGAPQGYAFTGAVYVYGLSPEDGWIQLRNYPGFPSSAFGAAVACAGDVDGDGYDDLLVGAPHKSNPESQEGVVYLYRGSPSGLPAAQEDYDWSAESNLPGTRFGGAVGAAGDVNADGCADVIVGACLFDEPQFNAGGAFLYLGGPAGLASAPAWSDEGTLENGWFGSAVAGAGDVNGDGADDVAVGESHYQAGEIQQAGKAYVYQAIVPGVSSLEQFRLDGAASIPAGGHTYETGFVASVLVSNPAGGAVELEIEVRPADLELTGDPTASAPAPSPGAHVSIPVTGLAHGGYRWQARAHSPATGFHSPWRRFSQAPADFSIEINFAPALTASDQVDPGTGAVIPIGGTPGRDVVAFAWTVNDPNGDDSRIEVEVRPLGEEFSGTATAVSEPAAGGATATAFAQLPTASYHWRWRAVDVYGEAAAWASFGGNGEETADFRIMGGSIGAGLGCQQAASASGPACGVAMLLIAGLAAVRRRVWAAGAVVLALTSLGGSPVQAPQPDWTAESNIAGPDFGTALAVGDVNGDGFDDFIVGASYHIENDGQPHGRVFCYFGSAGGLSPVANWTAAGGTQIDPAFGAAVAAGDVNGDLIDDVIVGTPYFSNDQGNEGRVSVFFGRSFDVPGSEPDWAGEGNQSNARLGGAVAAGDVNGDGVDDVIAGAALYDNGQANEGRVFLFLGSSTGPLPTPAAWTAESNSANSWFGNAVSAGDLNGDQVDDVVVGAYLYANGENGEGAAFVYYGRLGTVPLATHGWSVEGNSVTAKFGHALSAGDLNGDGIDDLVVGAATYSGAYANEGRVLIYAGREEGLEQTESWTAEGGADGVRLGRSVCADGDMNGDGIRDLIVGAQLQVGQLSAGRIALYYGGQSGLPASPAWSLDGEQPDAMFGWAVAAGDVNGDGAGDVLAGAPRITDPENWEGRVYAFHGEASAASDPRQFRLDGQTEVPAGGVCAQAGFVARGTVADPAPGMIRLEVEAQLIGVEFSGIPTASGDPVSGGQEASAVVTLVPGDYHWQARARNVTTNGASAWRSLGTNPDAIQEMDLRIRANHAPALSDAGQFDPRNGAAIPEGRGPSGSAVEFAATGTDPEGDVLRLEVEVLPLGTAFSGTATIIGALAAAGGIPEVSTTLGVASYHWRSRTVDEWGARGDWVSYGGNGENEADFLVTGGSLGNANSCQQRAGGGAAWLTMMIALAALRLRR